MKDIKIGDHYIQIPEPRRRDEIINIDKKKDDAVWHRQEDIPKIFYDYGPQTKIYQSATLYDQDENLISLSEDDTKLVARYLQRELYRRTYGVHFNNCGEIIWMHNDYYFNLQWGPMIGLTKEWGDFRWFQNDFHIHRGWGIHNPHVAGMFTTKPKKTGITQILAGAYLNEATMQEKKELIMMSKTGPDVHDVNMNFFFYMYDKLPYIMKPNEKKRNLSEIIFGTPTTRISTGAKSKLEQYKGRKIKALNTRVSCVNTKESGMDGPKVHRGWVDEYPKTWEGSSISPDAIYKKTIETVKVQMDIQGFLDYTSYIPELDDRGFKEAKEIWNKSKKINPNTARTETEMITHLILVQDAMEGQFLPNGKCDRRKTLHFINTAVAAKSESSEKQRLRRQYPTKEADAWGAGGLGSTFDNVRLADIYNEAEKDIMSGVRPYKTGHFIWANEKWEQGEPRPKGMFSFVHWVELTDEEIILGKEDKVKIFHQIPAELHNAVLAKDSRHEDDGRLCPLKENLNVGSFDPTDYIKKKDVQQGSKNAGHTMNLYSSELDTFFRKPASNIILSEYFFRPDHPDEAYEDLVKEIIFFGKYVIVEANKPWVCTKLIDDGLQHFLLLKKTDGTIGPYRPGDEQHFVYTTEKVIEDYCRAIALYIVKPRLINSTDYGMTIKSLQTLQQLMDFDPLNTKKYDLAVSFGYCLLGLRAFSIFRNEWLGEDGNYNADTLKVAMAEIQNL